MFSLGIKLDSDMCREGKDGSEKFLGACNLSQSPFGRKFSANESVYPWLNMPLQETLRSVSLKF
jgi:hypothetical protein